jgi:iron complex outermembrane receptor protein
MKRPVASRWKHPGLIPADKIGTSPDRKLSVRGFFAPGRSFEPFKAGGAAMKSRMKVAVLLGMSLFVSFFSGTGFAGQEREQEAVKMQEMVVTATRTPEKKQALPANITVISAKEIQSTAAQSVPDLLKHQTGIQVADYTGTGRTTTVDLRGFGERADANTLVMVDGRRVNPPDMSGVDWTTIPLERIERIEIIRGGGSVLYGNNATGGVINIITKKGAAEPTLSAKTSMGSYEYFKQSIGYLGSSDSWQYNLDAGYLDTDGYRDNGYLRSRTAGLNLSYGGDWYGVDLQAGGKDDKYGLPGAVKKDEPRRSTNTPDDYAQTQDQYLQFNPYIEPDMQSKLSLALYGREYASDSHWEKYDMQRKYEINDYGFSPQYSRDFELLGLSQSLVAGLDYHNSKLEESGVEDKKREETGLFIQNRINLTKELLLTLGYRSTWTEFDVLQSQESFTIDSANLGLTYNYVSNSKLFFSFDRAFRTVLLDELGGPDFDQILRPQISNQYQIGVSHRFSQELRLEATAFRMDTDQEILYDPQELDPGQYFPGQNVNYEQTRRQGLELEARLDPHPRLGLSAGYTWLDNELRGDRYNGNPIPGVAEHSAYASAMFRPLDNLVLDVRGRWLADKSMTSDWEDEVGDDWEGGDYFVLDAMLSYDWRFFTFAAGVNNILDEEYSEYGTYQNGQINLYPSPERNYLARISLELEF